eukprot:12905381-Prorocentrum_lima.AAC.1
MGTLALMALRSATWPRRRSAPTAAKVAQHEATGHVQHRSWCRVASLRGVPAVNIGAAPNATSHMMRRILTQRW